MSHPTATLAPSASENDVDRYFVAFDMVVAGRRSKGFYERDEARMGLKDTVHDIASGELENVDRVYCGNLAMNSFQDVTEDVARAVLNYQLDRGCEVEGPVLDFCEEHLGVAVVNEAIREAA